MGLIDKFKNMFTEEIEVEEPIKKEVTQVEITAPSKKTEVKENDSKIVDDAEEKKQVVLDEKSKKEDEFSFPVFFDDDDFKEIEKEKKEEPPFREKKYGESSYREKKYGESSYRESYRSDKKEKDLYQGNTSSKTTYIGRKEQTKSFKPTPIISPIYGVLDKNYHKEDITTRNDIIIGKTVKTNEMTVDDIRKKAYGTLEDDLENNLVSHEKLEKNQENDLFEQFEVKEDIPSREEKNKDIDNLVEEELNEPHEDFRKEEDLFNLINAMYQDEEEEK